MHCDTQQVAEPLLTLLCDPQTAGGLLFSIPEEALPRVLTQLREAGVNASEIGKVLVKNGDSSRDILLH
jgi:selenide,water dikinase